MLYPIITTSDFIFRIEPFIMEFVITTDNFRNRFAIRIRVIIAIRIVGTYLLKQPTTAIFSLLLRLWYFFLIAQQRSLITEVISEKDNELFWNHSKKPHTFLHMYEYVCIYQMKKNIRELMKCQIYDMEFSKKILKWMIME